MLRFGIEPNQAHFSVSGLKLWYDRIAFSFERDRFIAWSYESGHNLRAQVLWFALRMEQLDGDIVEGAAGVGAGDVGEVAGGVAELAVGHDQMGFGPALDGINDVGGAERNVQVRYIVLMEKRGAMRGDAYAEDANVIIFQDEMMMRLLWDGDGSGSLGAEGKNDNEQSQAGQFFNASTWRKIKRDSSLPSE